MLHQIFPAFLIPFPLLLFRLPLLELVDLFPQLSNRSQLIADFLVVVFPDKVQIIFLRSLDGLLLIGRDKVLLGVAIFAEEKLLYSTL